MTGAIHYFLLLLAADIVASAALWHGTPTDWTSGPLRFWVFEGIRLRYWASFCLVLSALGGFGWIGLRRLLSAALLRYLLVAICSLGAEVLTSIYFWKGLPVDQAGYLGWLDLRRYAFEHLASWIVIVLIGVGFGHLWDRRKHNDAH